MLKAGIFTTVGIVAGLSSFILLPLIAIALPFLAGLGLVYAAYEKTRPRIEKDDLNGVDDFRSDWLDWRSYARKPKVWIVDDDRDMAVLMQNGLMRLGINANVITDVRDLHRRMSFERADYILLDWMLSSDLTAAMVMEKAIRLISTFSDLKHEFEEQPPQVMTYSVLAEHQIQVPKSQFFDHVGHLEKSKSSTAAITQFSKLIHNANHTMEASHENSH